MLNAGNRCKTSQTGVFLKDPGSALCVCGALYVPIDKIKEQRDESGAKRRERGRERKEKGCFTSLPSY